MECAAISCITNKAAGSSGERLDHKDVLAIAATQTERVGRLIEEFLHIVEAHSVCRFELT